MPLTKEILLVEDSPTDADLTLEALRDLGLEQSLTTVEDGESALAYLRREAPYEEATRPDLILLDLNLPGQHGADVLRAIKRDAVLRAIPVVVLTHSDDHRDVANSWEHEADGYLVKPITPPQLQLAMGIIAKRGVRTRSGSPAQVAAGVSRGEPGAEG